MLNLGSAAEGGAEECRAEPEPFAMENPLLELGQLVPFSPRAEIGPSSHLKQALWHWN